ncbi:30S ribosomal protein S5 [bacterium]|nr:30S ribosomal protein S5 [bacterium]
MTQYSNETGSDQIEKVIRVNRSSKVVKGGRRFSFSALVVVGDAKGQAGLGFGKANEVSEAIRKALEDANKSMVRIATYRTTIPHTVVGKYKGGQVILKPATSGTGIIAGGAVRAVMEAIGIRDILSKSLGSNNSMNVAKAAMTALESLITKKEAFKRRGIVLKEYVEETIQPAEVTKTSVDKPSNDAADQPAAETATE